MTLDPVFRSKAAIRQIEEDGFLEHMADSLIAQAETIEYIHGLMPEIIDGRFLHSVPPENGEIEFLQNNFFLTLFHSIFKSLGTDPDHLRFYVRANFCIKGIVTAGDNLFDDEEKMLLPFNLESGARFASILQLLTFDRLIHRVCDDTRKEGWLEESTANEVHRSLLNMLADIGTLEGSEEHGVDEILPVDEMIEKVHRVRGGSLFSLAFVPPKVIETGEMLEKFERAEKAIDHLGTAFQIVDDLTDFEFDLTRKSHNILVAAAVHEGDAAAKSAIASLLEGGEPTPNMVETVFGDCARSVLAKAEAEGRRAFEILQDLGFWFDPDRAALLVQAIVGLEGVSRIEELVGS